MLSVDTPGLQGRSLIYLLANIDWLQVLFKKPPLH